MLDGCSHGVQSGIAVGAPHSVHQYFGLECFVLVDMNDIAVIEVKLDIPEESLCRHLAEDASQGLEIIFFHSSLPSGLQWSLYELCRTCRT